MADIALDLNALLTELGFDSPSTQAQARALLVESKLTTPTKTRIDSAKRPRVEEALRARFLVTCGSADCARELKGRELVQAHHIQHCWVCHGSPNRRAAQNALDAMKRARMQKLVIVGGSPAVHDELRQLLSSSIELRLVSGTDRRTLDLARGDLRWADLVMLWGSSELDHKVSTLYVNQKEQTGANIVIVNRRGIAALLDAVVQHVAKSRYVST